MKRHPKTRPRREFLHLEAQLEPDFENKAWRQTIDEVVHGKEPGTKSYAPQFKLRARILRMHARRNRWNATRRLVKRNVLASQMRPEYALYAAAGLLKVAEAGCDEYREDLIRGALCTDTRLTKKFLLEMESIHEWMNPAIPPWEIDCRRARAEAEAETPAFAERQEFESSLRPTQIPEEIPNALPFLPDQAETPACDGPQLQETDSTQAAS